MHRLTEDGYILEEERRGFNFGIEDNKGNLICVPLALEPREARTLMAAIKLLNGVDDEIEVGLTAFLQPQL